MKKQKQYERFEDYLTGNLTVEENQKFKDELDKNEDLRTELELHQQLHEDFSSDVMSLKSKLNAVHLNEQNKNKKGQAKILRLVLRYSSIAAVLILGIVFIPGIFKSDLSPDEVYNQNYDTYAMALNQRSNGETDNITFLNDAIQNYLDKDYDQAALDFQSIYQLENNNLYLFYAASSLQAAEDYENAIQIYDEIIKSGDNQLIQQSQWFKALSLIKLDEIDSAKSLLLELGDDHYQKERISQILKSL